MISMAPPQSCLSAHFRTSSFQPGIVCCPQRNDPRIHALASNLTVTLHAPLQFRYNGYTSVLFPTTRLPDFALAIITWVMGKTEVLPPYTKCFCFLDILH